MADIACRCGHMRWSHTTVTYPTRREPCGVCLNCGQAIGSRSCCRDEKRCSCEDFQTEGVLVEPDLRDAAARAAVWQVVEQAAKARKDEAKAELRALEEGDTVAGKILGQIVGKAYWVAGRAKIDIVDEPAFMAWVKQHHPTEIIESVNPAYVKSLEQTTHSGVVCDSQGEVIPGVQPTVTEPYLTVRRDKNAEQIVAGLLAHGCIQLEGIREITPRVGG